MQSTTEPEVCEEIEQFCIQSELKKLTVLERIQLLNKIRQEEEQEDKEKLKVLEDEVNKEVNKEISNEVNNMSSCGKQMNSYNQAIMSELQNLRKQVQEIRYEIQYLNNNQHKINKQLQINKLEEYESENSCSVISFVSEWMPIWIFISFVIFTLVGRPKICSINGSSGLGSSLGGGACPVSGLGGMCDMFTKM